MQPSIYTKQLPSATLVPSSAASSSKGCSFTEKVKPKGDDLGETPTWSSMNAFQLRSFLQCTPPLCLLIAIVTESSSPTVTCWSHFLLTLTAWSLTYNELRPLVASLRWEHIVFNLLKISGCHIILWVFHLKENTEPTGSTDLRGPPPLGPKRIMQISAGWVTERTQASGKDTFKLKWFLLSD